MDGLSGTVFAMEATIRALVDNLPQERKANPTVAILGGGGYIGSRLVSVLATRPPGASTGGVAPLARRSTGKGGSLLEPQSSFSLEVEPQTADFKGNLLSALNSRRSAVGMSATVTLREREATVFRQIIALDTRYADKRHCKAGVLYTAEPRDLEAADVVLVITRNGDDVHEYVRHSQAGQVRRGLLLPCRDPEMTEPLHTLCSLACLHRPLQAPLSVCVRENIHNTHNHVPAPDTRVSCISINHVSLCTGVG